MDRGKSTNKRRAHSRTNRGRSRSRDRSPHRDRGRDRDRDRSPGSRRQRHRDASRHGDHDRDRDRGSHRSRERGHERDDERRGSWARSRSRSRSRRRSPSRGERHHGRHDDRAHHDATRRGSGAPHGRRGAGHDMALSVRRAPGSRGIGGQGLLTNVFLLRWNAQVAPSPPAKHRCVADAAHGLRLPACAGDPPLRRGLPARDPRARPAPAAAGHLPLQDGGACAEHWARSLWNTRLTHARCGRTLAADGAVRHVGVRRRVSAGA
jgi:hypothetical protein